MNRPAYGGQGRIGLIVPPANVTLEPELAELLRPGVSLHATRLPGRVVADTSVGLRERFLEYNANLAAAADSFGGAELSAVCFGVTGSCYMVGPEGEEKLIADLGAGGAPSGTTAARAISLLVKALGCRRIGLVSPYPDWVTKLASAHWQASGFDVVRVVSVPNVVSIYDVDTSKVVATATELRDSGADVILLSGTGVPTLPAIRELNKMLPIPVISSNLSLGWWINETLGGKRSGDKQPADLRALDRWIEQAAERPPNS